MKYHGPTMLQFKFQFLRWFAFRALQIEGKRDRGVVVIPSSYDLH